MYKFTGKEGTKKGGREGGSQVQCLTPIIPAAQEAEIMKTAARPAWAKS
jgi:hypothetical protein